jgi:cardiolipin synthase
MSHPSRRRFPPGAVLAAGLTLAVAAPAFAAPPPAAAPQWVPAAAVPATATQLIAAARQTVEVEMYELGNPQLLQALRMARHRGVRVTVILDATEVQSRRAVPLLRAAGVAVEAVRVTTGIDHVKLLVVDGHRALVGGVNWGTGSIATWDADVELPDDPGLARIFAADWRVAAHHQAATGAWPDPALPGIWSGHAIAPALTRLIQSAHHQVDVVANYCTDWAVQNALIAAARRGFLVRVVLNRSAYGAASAARWLQDHGVIVRWAPRAPYLHAKIVLVDGRAGIIGSANFSDDALAARNHELDVAIPAAVMPAATRWWTTLWARSQVTQ